MIHVEKGNGMEIENTITCPKHGVHKGIEATHHC